MFSMLFCVKSWYIELDHGSFVVVRVTVVGSREDRDDKREIAVVPLVHLVAIKLGFVRSDNREQFVGIQEV